MSPSYPPFFHSSPVVLRACPHPSVLFQALPELCHSVVAVAQHSGSTLLSSGETGDRNPPPAFASVHNPHWLLRRQLN